MCAAVAELADAYDSKSYGKPYGFESHQRQEKKLFSFWLKSFFIYF